MLGNPFMEKRSRGFNLVRDDGDKSPTPRKAMRCHSKKALLLPAFLDRRQENGAFLPFLLRQADDLPQVVDHKRVD